MDFKVFICILFVFVNANLSESKRAIEKVVNKRYAVHNNLLPYSFVPLSGHQSIISQYPRTHYGLTYGGATSVSYNVNYPRFSYGANRIHYKPLSIFGAAPATVSTLNTFHVPKVPALVSKPIFSAAGFNVPLLSPEIPQLTPEVPLLQPQVPLLQPQFPVVQSQVPFVHPSILSLQPSVPSAQPPASSVQPPLSSTRPQTPSVQHQVPSVQPQIPGLQPQIPVIQSQIPGLQSQIPGLQPQIPVSRPQTPSLQPQSPSVQPPSVQPQIPSIQSQTPLLQPELTLLPPLIDAGTLKPINAFIPSSLTPTPTAPTTAIGDSWRPVIPNRPSSGSPTSVNRPAITLLPPFDAPNVGSSLSGDSFGHGAAFPPSGFSPTNTPFFQGNFSV